jgi:putative ABC transport system permease protein
MVPALVSSPVPSASLKEGGRGASQGRGGARVRSLLVASEFGIALVLLVGAGLLIRSFVALQAVDPGFEPRNVLSAVVSVPGGGANVAERRSAFVQQLLAQVERLPGVTSSSAINHLPLAGDIWGWPFWVEGRPIPRPGEGQGATYRVALPGYFRTMGIELLRGRDLSSADTLDAPGVVVVNQRLAERFWPGEDVLGKRLTLDNPERRQPRWLTVVGVVENAKRRSWTEAAGNELYVAYLQSASSLQSPSPQLAYVTLVVRTAGPPAALAPAVRGLVFAADKSATVSEVQTMEHVVASAIGEPRFYLWLLSAFATVALALAAVGIYGVMSYSVSRRTQEIGIRLALGASAGDVRRLVVVQGLGVAGIGAAAGLLAALALARLMTALLYETGPADPAAFLAAVALLVLVALIASDLPARRATRIDPLTALRHD